MGAFEILGLCYGILQLALNIATVAIGHQYNDEDSCHFEVSKSLLVMGGIGIFIAFLYILTGFSFCAPAFKLLPHSYFFLKVFKARLGFLCSSVTVFASVSG